MMQDAITNFSKQFNYEPMIENAKKWQHFENYIMVGMGGSHLAGDMVLAYSPKTPLRVRRDYGLPKADEKLLRQSLIICSSYSGNTEEVIDAYNEAKENKLSIVNIAVGGKLIELAKKDNTPYIQIPNTGIQPRSALGFSLVALFKVLDNEKALWQLKKLNQKLDSSKIEPAGKSLACRMKNFVPVIYASQRNETIAWNWKIKMNETGKIPAYHNVLPEMNHNEMNGFDVKATSKHLSDKFYFLILKDKADNPRVTKRMEILEKLYKDRGLKVESMWMDDGDYFERSFNSLLLADWTAVYTAEQYGLESEQVPMVEEFKRLTA